jgi:hypothetical protein
MRSRRIVCACEKHDIGVPVIEFSYVEYPFKITVGSTTSLFPPGYDKNSVRKEWEEAIKDGESTSGASIVMILYPTGQNVRMQTSKVVLPTSNVDSADFVLDLYYTMQLIEDDGSLSPI